METNEKKIKELSETIVKSIVDLSMGKEPNFLSNSIYRTISKHPNLIQIKQLIVEHLQSFDGKVETPEEWKRLSEFRYNLLKLHGNA